MRCCAIGSIRWSEVRSAGITSLSNSAACGPPRSARHCAIEDALVTLDVYHELMLSSGPEGEGAPDAPSR